MRARWIQALVMAAVAAAGIYAYGRIVRPDRSLLARAAEQRLREIFGPGVSYDSVRIDLIRGVEIRGLRVTTSATKEPTFSAERVEVRHDVLSLVSGAYRPAAIVIEKARVVTHETESGLAPDFPFTLEEGPSGRPMPRLVVSDATVFYRSMAASQRLRKGTVLVLDHVDLVAAPAPSGRVEVQGGFRTRGLEQDDVRIAVTGWADARDHALELKAVWDPFRLTPHVLDHVLAESIASKLRGRSLDEGRLEVTVSRQPGAGTGESQVAVTWEGHVRVDVAEIPGAERIDARTKEQLQALLGPGRLRFSVTPHGIDIQGLATALGGGSVQATGRIEEDGEVVHLDIRVRGLRLEDPAIRKALGEEGAAIFDQFQASGRVDADVRIVKEHGKDLDFEVNAILDGVSFRYIGPLQADGTRAGFPYPVVDASGTVRITPGVVEFGDIVGVGAHTRASFLLRGRHRSSWTGGETGRILITDKGPDIRITVEGSNVPVDADLREAVAGSEFAGLLDTYRLEGVVERFEVDVISVPGVDTAALTEVRVTLGKDRFRYSKFPLDLDDVSGWVTMRRPLLDEKRRGRVFAFDVTGSVDGAPAHVWAEYRAHEKKGRLQIRADSVGLAGPVTSAILTSQATAKGIGEVWRFFEPRGRADLQGSFPLEQDPDPIRLSIALKDASVRLDAARAEHAVEIGHLGGKIEVVGDRVEVAGVRGALGDARVSLEGVVDGGTEGRWDLRLETDVLRLTSPLLAELSRLSAGESFLPEGFRLEPDGRMALSIHLLREPGPTSALHADVVAKSLDASLTLPKGHVVSVHGDRMDLRRAQVRLTNVVAEGEGIAVTAKEALLSDDGVHGTFSVALDKFEATAESLSMLPAAVRDEVASLFADRIVSSPGVEIEAPEAGGIALRGALTLTARPGKTGGDAPLGTLEAAPLAISPDAPGGRTLSGVLRFQDLTYDPGLALDKVTGTVRLDRLRLGADGEGSGTLESLTGKIAGVGVAGLTAPVAWHDGILVLDPVSGTLAKGRLTGRLRMHTRAPEAYEGNVKVEGFRLEALREDLAPTGPPYAGRGDAEIRFENRGTSLHDLSASGTIRVRDGNLGDLPAVANIFALLGDVLPVKDPPKFEHADVEFTLRDEVVHFQQLDLGGPLFDMPGRGTLDLTGIADLTFTPDCIKSMLLPGVMQLPVIGKVLGGVLREELLYAVRVRGDIATAEPSLVVLPPLHLGDDHPSFEGTGVPQALPRPLPRWFR